MVGMIVGGLVCVAVLFLLTLDWWRHPKAVEEWRTRRWLVK
jgi:hypothetical protein